MTRKLKSANIEDYYIASITDPVQGTRRFNEAGNLIPTFDLDASGEARALHSRARAEANAIRHAAWLRWTDNGTTSLATRITPQDIRTFAPRDRLSRGWYDLDPADIGE